MAQPIVIAHHLIWTVYGTWLPNDPRGSGSRHVACDAIAELGELHYGRKSVQPAGWEIRAFYEKATGVLKHPVLLMERDEISTVADAFAEVCAAQRYTCYGCAVMPDHVHMVIRKHRDLSEEMIDQLQGLSRERLGRYSSRFAGHPVWSGGGGWKVFLDHPDRVERTVRYVEQNPVKSGLAVQRWPFVKRYDRWPLHPGHSLNSPYVKALKAAGRYP